MLATCNFSSEILYCELENPILNLNLKRRQESISRFLTSNKLLLVGLPSMVVVIPYQLHLQKYMSESRTF
ncbi:hypothetical protein Mapa_005319 [Marchantia paleacea]|nr:hypothetical protein Mapa_005319 [Marchantia paleacea]